MRRRALEPREWYDKFWQPCVRCKEERLGNELQQRATEIAGMLSVVCPKCGMVQDPDPSGCIAVRCGHCSEAYCWMCFELCGRDAHAHAIQAHKTYFPSRALVAAWHRRWRWWRVFAALDKHYPIGTGAGAPAAKAKRAKLLDFPLRSPAGGGGGMAPAAYAAL